jgi:hypothetical protein
MSGDEARREPLADIGGDAAQRREAPGVVRPVPPFRGAVGRAGALEEVGSIDDEQVEGPARALRSRAGPPNRPA